MTMPPKPDVDPPADTGSATTGRELPEPDELQRFRRLVEKANAGDAAAIADLRHYLDDHPHIWQHVGDLAKVAMQAWIALVAGNDLLARESLQRRLDQLRADLIGDEAGPIDRLLAEQVLATWLEANYLQMVVADAKGGNATTNRQILLRLESAQRRHLAAMKQFVTVRKLLPRDFTLRIFEEPAA